MANLQLRNPLVQGTDAEGLLQALALLWERRHDGPRAVPVIACHDEIVVERDAEQADVVAAWLWPAMAKGMVLPIEVEPVVVLAKGDPRVAGAFAQRRRVPRSLSRKSRQEDSRLGCIHSSRICVSVRPIS
jgi:hypothetical protein